MQVFGLLHTVPDILRLFKIYLHFSKKYFSEVFTGKKYCETQIEALAICHHHFPVGKKFPQNFPKAYNIRDFEQRSVARCGYSVNGDHGWTALSKNKAASC